MVFMYDDPSRQLYEPFKKLIRRGGEDLHHDYEITRGGRRAPSLLPQWKLHQWKSKEGTLSQSPVSLSGLPEKIRIAGSRCMGHFPSRFIGL